MKFEVDIKDNITAIKNALLVLYDQPINIQNECNQAVWTHLLKKKERKMMNMASAIGPMVNMGDGVKSKDMLLHEAAVSYMLLQIMIPVKLKPISDTIHNSCPLMHTEH